MVALKKRSPENKSKVKNVEQKEINKDVPKVKNKYYPKLPFYEVLICVILWGGGVVGSISTLVSISTENEKRYLHLGYLTEGWRSWIGRYQNTNDSEWVIWKKFLWEGTIPGFIGHFLVARVVERIWPARRYEIFLAYSLFFTTYFLGVQGVFYLLTHFAIQYLAVFITKSVAVCWITGIFLIFVMHSDECVSFLLSLYEDQDKAYFLMIVAGMSNLRYIGFSLEYAWSYNVQPQIRADTLKKPSNRFAEKSPNPVLESSKEISLMNNPHFGFGFLDLLIYQMYFPLFYGGPIMNYNEFAMQRKQSPLVWTRDKISRFLFGMLRYVFWHVFIDVFLHFVYVSAIVWDTPTILQIGLFQLCGLSMAQVCLFYMKYVIFYGMPSHFATSDNLDVPGQPQCVYSKHRMTDFWKLIDKGLHKWLVRYIYIPCGGSKAGIFRAIVSLTASFIFVTYWHTPTHAHIWWGIFSWFGVLIEHIALSFYRTERVQFIEKRYLTPAWSRRIRGFFSCFVFGFLIVANLYFLGGLNVGNIYWNRFYYENIAATLLIHVSLYGGTQSSMESV